MVALKTDDMGGVCGATKRSYRLQDAFTWRTNIAFGGSFDFLGGNRGFPWWNFYFAWWKLALENIETRQALRASTLIDSWCESLAKVVSKKFIIR